MTEYIFMGITQDPQLKIISLAVFLLVYLANVVGNVGMIILIITDTQLHTPMYFFPLQPLFCQPGLLLSHCPRDAGCLPNKAQSHLFSQLCHPVCILHRLCGC